jgi:hypothetical protein
MRTTLNIDDDLMVRAKIRAAERRTTLTAIIEDALRDALHSEPRGQRKRIELPTWDGGGFPPGVDWDSNAAVLEFLDEHEQERRG